MKSVAATEAKNRYERLRSGNVRAFLDLRREVAAEAAAKELTDERLVELLTAVEA